MTPLNGHELFSDRSIPGLPKQGPLKIVPDGPVDFANVYVTEQPAAPGP